VFKRLLRRFTRKPRREALKIRRQLVQQNPDTCLPYVAQTLGNLGILDATQNRMEEARAHYREAISIYKEFSKRDPSRYTVDIATIESALAKLEQKTTNK